MIKVTKLEQAREDLKAYKSDMIFVSKEIERVNMRLALIKGYMRVYRGAVTLSETEAKEIKGYKSERAKLYKERKSLMEAMEILEREIPEAEQRLLDAMDEEVVSKDTVEEVVAIETVEETTEETVTIETVDPVVVEVSKDTVEETVTIETADPVVTGKAKKVPIGTNELETETVSDSTKKPPRPGSVVSNDTISEKSVDRWDILLGHYPPNTAVNYMRTDQNGLDDGNSGGCGGSNKTRYSPKF